MTYSDNEKNIAIAISLSIAFAFAGTTTANADNRFPPSHTTGTFNESSEPSTTKVSGAYYRADTNNVVEARIYNGKYEVAFEGTGIAPYYRAAN